jgi:hypothetical protein
MAWNKAILTTQGDKNLIDNLIPDVMFKSKEGLHFDEAISGMIDQNLTVGFHDNRIIINDVLGRFISKDQFPKDISSKNNECKIFWISEDCIYRQYKNGQLTKEIRGREDTEKELVRLGIKPIDQWGETMILQLLDYEVFGVKREQHGFILWDVPFDLYQFD